MNALREKEIEKLEFGKGLWMSLLNCSDDDFNDFFEMGQDGCEDGRDVTDA